MHIQITQSSGSCLFEYFFENKYFNHTLKFPSTQELEQDALFRIALLTRPTNAKEYQISNLQAEEDSINHFESLLRAKIKVDSSFKSTNSRQPTNLSNECYLCFSGGFDSIAAKTILGEKASLISFDHKGNFAREAEFFRRFDTKIFEWNIRGKRKDIDLRFNESLDWRALIAPAISLKKSTPICIATGTILESSPYWLNGSQRNPFSSYSNYGLGPGIGLVYSVASLSEFGTTRIAKESLENSTLRLSLKSLAKPTSFKRYRKEVLLKLVDDLAPLDKPPKTKKHAYGSSITDDVVSLYLAWKLGREWTLNNFVDYLPEEAQNLNLAFFEKVNPNNLNVIDPNTRPMLLQSFRNFGLFEYNESDIQSLIETNKLLKESRRAPNLIALPPRKTTNWTKRLLKK